MTNKSVVSITGVDTYQAEQVLTAMRACLEPLGGMKAFVQPGQKVLLKPNILGGLPPEKAVTTHPTVVRSRRSVRRYREAPVPKDLLHELLDVATWAPSACNKQDWRFVLVDDKAIMSKIVDAGGAIIIPKAPQGILVSYRESVRNAYYRDDVQSACACIQNFLLMAAARGIATCWICHLPRKGALRSLFKIPADFQPIAYIMVGYADDGKFTEVARKHKIGDITGNNSFKNIGDDTKKSAWPWAEKKLANGYRFMPLFLKKLFLNRLLDKNFVKKFKN